MRYRIFFILAFQIFLAASATADEYPSRPIRMIVPFAPGGTADLIARPLALKLGELLGESIVVINRGGAGGVVGASLVAQAQPDGYTILLGSNGALTISQHLGPVPYDTVKDFSPVGIAATSQFVLVTHPSVPAKNVKELIALGKSKGGQLNYGSAGVGNVGHLAAELFNSMTGIRMVHVPYAGAGPMMLDLLSGRVDMAFPGLSSVLPNIKAGKLRALAVSSKTRSALLPDVPTLDEAGLTGYNLETFWAILAPANTPKPIVQKLNAALLKALDSPELRKTYLDNSNEPFPSSPEQSAQRIQIDSQKWAEIIRKADIKKD